MQSSGNEDLNALARDLRFFPMMMLAGFLLSTVWAVLVSLLKSGTLMGIVQVVLLLATVIFVAVPAVQYFKTKMPSPLAYLAAGGIWCFWVVLYRSLVLELLGII